MKKWVATVLAGVMMMSGAIAVSAETPGMETSGEQAAVESGTNRIAPRDVLRERMQARNEERQERKEMRKEALFEYSEQFSQINELQQEWLTIRVDLLGKWNEALALWVDAKEAGEEEKIQEANEIRGELEGIREEIRQIRRDIAEQRRAFREAFRNDDTASAEAALAEWIALKDNLNETEKQKLDIWDRIISALQEDAE